MSEEDRAAEAAAAARAKAAKAAKAKAERAARAKAAKAKAAREKAAKAAKAAAAAKATAAQKPSVTTLGVTRPAVATPPGTGTAVVASTDSSSPLGAAILLAITVVGALLVGASFAPLNYAFIPYRLAVAWHESRVGMAILGGSLLLLGLVFYFYALLHV